MADPYVFPNASLLTSQEHDIIGSGSFGMVRRVYNQKLGTAAVKIFRITGTLDHQQGIVTEAKKEASLLTLINHENVVRCHGVVVWSNYFAIVMDYIEGGTLYDFLRLVPAPIIPFKLRIRMMHELARALVYLHHSGTDQRVVHGDLKTKNVFLTDDLHIRLGDFGAATLATKTSDRSTQVRRNPNSTHTIVYAAPEFLRAIYGTRNRAMDVYSFGMVLYEIITRQAPFFDMQPSVASTERAQIITDAIIRGERPSLNLVTTVTDDLRERTDETYVHVLSIVDKMKECWQENENNRPKMDDIEHFFADIIRNFRAPDVIREVSVVVNQMQFVQRQPRPEDLISIDQVNL
uniref:CBL-interacting protein kinase 33-like n=1 Tax=Phallusia mammillata TaxID=59560 RepID=A0A6F9DRH2_9ASCI|nr:CBL-interacting protein kinase 33-like [Phallusia mammillata]